MKPVSSGQLATWAGEARERWHVPGLAVGVLCDGEVVTATDGVEELGRDDPVAPDSAFRIASITKPFVATLAMTLAEDGLLELDEPPPGGRVDATVRELLSHQAGLATEWPDAMDVAGEDDGALRRFAERDPTRLPVGRGELFAYSNAGYWVVGAAIAAAAGTTFEEAMAERVLAPLGLSETTFSPDRRVRGYEQAQPGSDELEAVERPYPRVRRPAGGLWSTTGDLLRFADHQLGGPGPLTSASIAELQRPVVSGPGFGAAMGWFVTRRGGRTAVEHIGSVAGFQSLLVFVPDERAAFAALSNSSRGLTAIKDVADQLGLGPEAPPDHRLSPDALAFFAGRYEGLGLELKLEADDGFLLLAAIEVDPLTGGEVALPSVRARPVADDEFEILDGEWRGERFDFPRKGIVRLGTLAVRVE